MKRFTRNYKKFSNDEYLKNIPITFVFFKRLISKVYGNYQFFFNLYNSIEIGAIRSKSQMVFSRIKPAH